MSKVVFSTDTKANTVKVGDNYYIKGISDHVIMLTTQPLDGRKSVDNYWRMYLLTTLNHKKILKTSRDLFWDHRGNILLATYNINLAIIKSIHTANELTIY